MTKDTGASADADRAGRASPEPASSLGHTATIPCADTMWGRLNNPEFRRGYLERSAAFALGAQLFGLMESRGMTAAQVAKAANVRTGDVKSVLRAGFRGDIRILQKIAA